jgi:hypothetical protein
MSLSQSVTDSLNDAQSHLRNALAFAARQERPSTCLLISNLMTEIEKISITEDILESLEEIRSNLEE